MIAGIAVRLRMTWRFGHERYFPLVPMANTPITIIRARSWTPIPLRRSKCCPFLAEIETQQKARAGDFDVMLFGMILQTLPFRCILARPYRILGRSLHRSQILSQDLSLAKICERCRLDAILCTQGLETCPVRGGEQCSIGFQPLSRTD